MAWGLPKLAPAEPRQGELNGGFTIARLKYTGGGDWYSDETSLRNLLKALKERGEIRVSQEKEAVVTPTDPEIWNYPMLFMTGHGNVKLNDDEARALRSYLDAGGLLWADDNFGMDKSFREVVKRLYPDSPLTELPFSHPLFKYPNAFPAGAPKVHEHDGGPARVFAVLTRMRKTQVLSDDLPSKRSSAPSTRSQVSWTTSSATARVGVKMRATRSRPACHSRTTVAKASSSPARRAVTSSSSGSVTRRTYHRHGGEPAAAGAQGESIGRSRRRGDAGVSDRRP